MLTRIIVFYGLTWFFVILLGGVQQAAGVPAEISLPQWGPGLAALLMLVLFRKDEHKIIVHAKNTPALRYLTAALIPAGAALVLRLAASLLGIPPVEESPAYHSLLLAVLWMPLGALGEELGWRGYLNKRLDARLGGLVSSLLVGLLWMPIHVSFLQRGLVMVALLTLLLMAYSVVIYALTHDTGFSVLLAGVFHLGINFANLLFLEVIYQPAFMALNAGVWALIAAIVVALKRNLFLSKTPTPPVAPIGAMRAGFVPQSELD
jgi:membrane protease YdiL (CAAX protease family)